MSQVAEENGWHAKETARELLWLEWSENRSRVRLHGRAWRRTVEYDVIYLGGGCGLWQIIQDLVSHYDDFIFYVESVESVIHSIMSDSETPWTAACQAPLSMEFSRSEYWRRLPFPSTGDLPNPGIKPGSPALQADSLASEPPGEPGGTSDKEPIWQCRRLGFNPWVRMIP